MLSIVFQREPSLLIASRQAFAKSGIILPEPMILREDCPIFACEKT